ncbi:MAG: glycosyltransferase family 2 protein [Candidatus Omnitrophica bacterium]|nr:glycosyltransferase family 2 protein [Candidatus Omnitrophota bacterium]
MDYSIVIPVYNEEESLIPLQEKINAAMEPISSDYEIIYVDDGSMDASGEVLRKLAAEYPEIKIVSFKKNRGQSAALAAGFRASAGAWIITLDADLQNPPQEISKLLPFKETYDFITGVRIKRQDGISRKLSSNIARSARWLILKDTTMDTGCSLRMFKREVIGRLPVFKNFHRFFAYLVKSLGFRIKEVNVQHEKRAFGVSKYGNLKRAWEGIFDLCGVFWLGRRLLEYEIKRD